MPVNFDETSNIYSSEFSTPDTTPMGTPLRKVFDRISGCALSWRNETSPRGRRIFHKPVESDEFQYANTHCLSSYYSVFVARLAIMVGHFLSMLVNRNDMLICL